MVGRRTNGWPQKLLEGRAPGGGGADPGQGLVEVAREVDVVLEAYREAQEVVRGGAVWGLDGPSVLDERLRPAKARCAPKNLAGRTTSCVTLHRTWLHCVVIDFFIQARQEKRCAHILFIFACH